jgi:hypothetical protein
MRLGLAVLGAAAVIGGYALVNSIQGRPAQSGDDGEHAASSGSSWLPGAIEDEPEAETRSYELIRYLNKDGSFGMVDDPTRVPPGATIVRRERKTVAVRKPAPAAGPADAAPDAALEEEERMIRMVEEREASSQRLAAIQRRVMETVLGSGLFGDAAEVGKVQKDLDAMKREAARMKACEDGDCPELAAPAPDSELRSAVPR